MKTLFLAAVAVCLGVTAYLLAWPVSVEPRAWTPTPDPGFTGAYAANQALAGAEFISLPAGEYGPEDIAVGVDGRLYTAVHSGKILAIDLASSAIEEVTDTGGRPLGIEFASDGTLWIADAYLGLLSLSPMGELKTVTTQADDGSPILYADDVDIAPDGRVYFSDASTRFGARDIGGTLAASLLDLMEHSANGRVVVYDPADDSTRVFAEQLTFANGVAVEEGGSSLLVNETGTYQVHRYSLSTADYGERETIVDGLPGFPDNVNRMPDGAFWVGIVSPRAKAMDSLASRPWVRKLVMRLPASARPGPTRYGFVLKIDSDGQILSNLQDPSGTYANTTGATELPDGRLAISSLTEPRIALVTP
ncbi:MAG: SMP-30/gluconolactonase/LRE family protein [Pseudomonadota bacterium]